MEISNRTNQQFISALFSQHFLQNVIDFIMENVDVDEVYTHAALKEFCKNNFKPDEVYEADVLCEYSTAGKFPEDIYTEEQLDGWALKNGYIKEKP